MQNHNYTFLEEYKNLDQLCRQIFMSDKGVTTYIDEMKAIPTFDANVIQNWSSDLSRLKDLRHTRNILSHEVGTLQQNMCTQNDIDWLKEFRLRIINQTDPLALFDKYKKSKAQSVKTSYVCQPQHQPIKQKPSGFSIVFYACFFTLILAVIAIIAVLLDY